MPFRPELVFSREQSLGEGIVELSQSVKNGVVGESAVRVGSNKTGMVVKEIVV